MSEEARKASAFVCARGHFEFNVLPFGIHSAPPSFQRLMRRVLEVPLREGWCQVYLDDILIFSKTEDDHKMHVARILELLADANMRIRVDKCNWFQREVAYLGHIITPDGVRMDPKKTNKIQEFEVPATIKKLMSFMGIINYYGKFLRKVNEVAAPLYELYKCKPTSKGKPVKNPTIVFDKNDPKVKEGYPLWEDTHQEAFVSLKKMVAEAVVDSLAYPNRDKPYTVLTDSSDKAIGGCLEQEGRPVAFYSQKLNDTQQRWSIYEKEAFALHQCLKKWRHLVYNRLPITCKVDNKGVSCLLKQNFTNNKQARWASFLQQFDIKLEFIKGVDNVVADALSRQWADIDSLEAEFSQQWPDFESLDIDNKPIVNTCSRLFALDILSEDSVDTDKDKVPEPDMTYNDDERQHWYSAYRDDPDWGPMVRHLTEGVQLVYKPIERYKQVRWSGGLLLYRDKIVVPMSLRPLLLRKAHDPNMHLGPAKMLYRLANFWWPDITKDVKSHCSHCLRCLRAKGTGKQLSAMPTPHDPPLAPFDRLHFDFVGPLPEVVVNGIKYNHALSIIDAYSKYAWSIPCRSNVTAEETVFLFMTHVVPFTGIPRLVIADGGKQFTSILTKEFARLMEIDLSFTAAYHPESNGVVERWHRDLGAALRVAISSVAGNRDWLQALPAAVLAHNTTFHQALGMSPHMCLFGQEARNPVSQLTTIHNLKEVVNRSATDRVANIERAHAKCKDTLAKAQERYKHTMEKRMGLISKNGELIENKVYVPREGDYVLLDSSRWGVMNKSKLQPRVLGPFLVEKVLGRNLRLSTPAESTFDPVVSCDDCILYDTEFYEDYPPELVLPKLIKAEDKVPTPASTKTVDTWHRDFSIDLGKKLGKVWPATITKAEFENSVDKHIKLHCQTRTGLDGELHDELTPVTFRKLIMGAPAIPNRKLHSVLFKFLVLNPQYIPPMDLQSRLHIVKAIQSVHDAIATSENSKNTNKVEVEVEGSQVVSDEPDSIIENNNNNTEEVSSEDDDDAFRTQSTSISNQNDEGSEVASEMEDNGDNAPAVDYDENEEEEIVPPSTPPVTPPSPSPKRFSVTKHPKSLLNGYYSDSSVTSSRYNQPKIARKSRSSSPTKAVKIKLVPEFEPISSRTRGARVNYRL